MASPTTLLLAWGNPGRRDDGLGPACAAMLEARAPSGLSVESGYQLQVEDAAEVARHRRVVFVDADRAGPAPFSCRRLAPAAAALGFTSHSVGPAALLTLARDLFHGRPEAWLVGIRGYEFDAFGEGLSAGARANLEAAVDFVTAAIASDRFAEVSAATAAAAGERRSEGP